MDFIHTDPTKQTDLIEFPRFPYTIKWFHLKQNNKKKCTFNFPFYARAINCLNRHFGALSTKEAIEIKLRRGFSLVTTPRHKWKKKINKI